MQMDALLWMIFPVLVAVGSALLAYYVMQAKLELAVAKERESLAEARATISTHQTTLEERVRATEEATRRKALDEFLQEFRVEERHYFRDQKSLLLQKRSMILQERLFFRNIPLSNWVEHEMTVEESGDVQSLAAGYSVFNAKSLSEEAKAPGGHFLNPPGTETALTCPRLASAIQ